MLVNLLEHCKVISRSHLLSCYVSGFNSLYLVLNTIDKRVVTRIIEGIIKLDSFLDIRIANIQVNHLLDYDKLIKLRYLVSLTSKDTPYIFDNKKFRFNLELAKTLLLNINNLLEKNYVLLNYQAFEDWPNSTIDILKVQIQKKIK